MTQFHISIPTAGTLIPFGHQATSKLVYARTTSAGQTEILAAQKTVKEANNELFIFRKEQGQWKIHRYLFATSNPPASN